MSDVLKGFMVLFLSVVGLNACQEINKSTQNPIDKSSSQGLPYTQDSLQETTLTAHINHLVDLCYDQPEWVHEHADSILNSFETQPAQKEGQSAYCNLLLNVGYLFREQGALLPAVKTYEKAYDYYLAKQLAQPDFLLYIAKPLTNLYTRIDDLAKAKNLQNRSIDEAKRQKRWDLLPSFYNNLAIIFSQLEDTEATIRAARSGLSYTQNGSIYEALLNNVLSEAYLNQGQGDSAALFNRQALKLFEHFYQEGDTLIWVSNALKVKSDLALMQQRPQQAQADLKRALVALETRFPDSKQRSKAKLYLALGQVYLQRNSSKASACFRKGLERLQPKRNGSPVADFTYTELLHGLAQAYSKEEVDSAIQYYQATIESAYLSQELVVSKRGNFRNSKWNQGILTEYLSLLEAAYQKAPDADARQELAATALWVIELSKGRQVLREIARSQRWAGSGLSSSLREKLKQLQELQLELAQTKDTAQIENLKEKMAQLQFEFQLDENYFDRDFEMLKKENFLHYLVTQAENQAFYAYYFDAEQNLYLVSLFKKEWQFKVISSRLWQEQQLPEWIEDYFGSTPYTYENDPERYHKKAERLATLLFPDKSALASTIRLSPDGLLFRLPMDALRWKGHFLAENHEISATYSFLIDYLEQNRGPGPSKIQIFAKSKFQPPLGDLPSVLKEAQRLSRDFHTESYVDEQATVANFLSHLGEGNILHLATHAVSKPDPTIVLNADLNLNSLSLNVFPYDLVVLSSCESGDGDLIEAEGLESLNKAFLSHGVGGVVASLWAVNDELAGQLMNAFYQQLSQSQDPIKSLVMAKRSLLQSSSSRIQNPWYWAAMQYVGQDQNVILKKKGVLWPWALLFLLPLGYWIFRKKKRTDPQRSP